MLKTKYYFHSEKLQWGKPRLYVHKARRLRRRPVRMNRVMSRMLTEEWEISLKLVSSIALWAGLCIGGLEHLRNTGARNIWWSDVLLLFNLLAEFGRRRLLLSSWELTSSYYKKRLLFVPVLYFPMRPSKITKICIFWHDLLRFLWNLKIWTLDTNIEIDRPHSNNASWFYGSTIEFYPNSCFERCVW